MDQTNYDFKTFIFTVGVGTDDNVNSLILRQDKLWEKYLIYLGLCIVYYC